VAAYDIPPSKEVTPLTEDDHEQVSLLFKNHAKKVSFLAFVTMQEFDTTVEKLIITLCLH